MKRILTAISIVLLFSGCVTKQHMPDNAYQFSWATVDSRKVENKVYEIVERKNPYSPSNANYSYRGVQKERRRLSNQVSSITDNICRLAKRKPSADKSYKNSCYVKAGATPEVVSLNKQIQELDQLSIKLYDYTKELRRFAKAQTIAIIKRYGDGKFDVVVRQGYDTIVLNKNGVALDITDAVLQEIDASKLIMNGTESNVSITK